ncbi:hypothetical protein BSKO_05590 [Bryopsis sp. KO-2023]|nr:hypothetical protein BSKO_05590 [Bryopsis sp. KO-2023]
MIRFCALSLAVILLAAHANAHEFEEAYEHEVFAMKKCDIALEAAYETYKFTQDMTKIDQPGPETTPLFYVYCFTYEKDAADSVMLVHPREELVGKTGKENGEVIINALQPQLTFASDSDIDGGLSMPSYKFNGATLGDDKIKRSLIMMIYGKNKKDLGKRFVCGCGLSETDADGKEGSKFFDDDHHDDAEAELEVDLSPMDEDHAHGPGTHTHEDD